MRYEMRGDGDADFEQGLAVEWQSRLQAMPQSADRADHN